METADPRAELIRKWSIESPGLMAEAGVSLADEGFSLATRPVKIAGLPKLKRDKKKANSKKAKHDKKKGHHNKSAHGSANIDLLRNFMAILQTNQHQAPQHHSTHSGHEEKRKKKKHVNQFKGPSITLAMLSAAHEEETKLYTETLTEIYSKGQIVIPDAIQDATKNAWLLISSYRNGRTPLPNVVAALQAMHNAAGLESKNTKFNTIRMPKKDLSIAEGESYVVDKFLTMLVKYIQKNVKDATAREQHHYKQIKALSSKLKKAKRHLRQIETALHHKSAHNPNP
jgi:translation initiation factor 2B subunit (eIF-2B alpha/beta/delta family)